MNNEDYCSYELSKRLKEKGFNWRCDYFYCFEENCSPLFCDGGKLFGMQFLVKRNFNNVNEDICSAPTLWDAQKWLREGKRLEVYVNWDSEIRWTFNISKINTDEFILSGCYDTYEKALEEGITKALELI